MDDPPILFIIGGTIHLCNSYEIGISRQATASPTPADITFTASVYGWVENSPTIRDIGMYRDDYVRIVDDGTVFHFERARIQSMGQERYLGRALSNIEGIALNVSNWQLGEP